MVRRSNRSTWVILYIVFGLYLVNWTFLFVKLPEFFADVDKWIFFVAGLLLIWGGFRYYQRPRVVGGF
ncbi:MAG: hypothetical protein KKB31_06560 [Nanoarchaeota archaeon]|nr:hypothetical protein [Nanoarchaeota archaeon]